MKSPNYRLGLLVLSVSVISVLYGDTVIGVASTRGSMEVNHAAVRGNANISDGTSIRTNDTISQVSLQNGAQVTLGQRSTASIHANYLQLTEGGAQIAGKGAFDVEALGFSIRTENNQGIAKVAYETPKRILISALNAPVRVADKEGVLLASIGPGTTYYFEPGSDDSPANTAAKKTSKSSTAKVAKHGLSNTARWGIVGGVAAAGTAVGLGGGLTGGNASR